MGHIDERKVGGKRFLVNALRATCADRLSNRWSANVFDEWERFRESHAHATMRAGSPAKRDFDFRHAYPHEPC